MKDEFHTKIVGVSKENEAGKKIQALLKDMSEYCCEGVLLSLEHERDNQYDKNAIKVYYEFDHIGYINKELAKELAPLVDQQRVEAEISEITGGEDGKSFGCNILIRTVPEGETARTDSREYVHLGKVSNDAPEITETAVSPLPPPQTYEAKESYFDGTMLQYFGYSLLAGIFTAITFGIGAAWAYCGLHRWVSKHTVIESKRLEFNGKGLPLLLLLLKLAVLPVLIVAGALLIYRPFVETGIGPALAVLILLVFLTISVFYSSFAFIQVKEWIISHTHFQAIAVESSQPTKAYTQQPASAPLQPAPKQKKKLDWVDIVEPILPLVCIALFCGIFFGIVFLIKLIFK